MSHIVTTKNINVTEVSALDAALDRLKDQGFVKGTVGKHKMYGRQTAQGLSVNLPGWDHPVVINTDSGEVKYDNFGGQWGAQVELDRLVQAYTLELAKEEAQLRGLMVEEEELEDGQVKLTATELVGAE